MEEGIREVIQSLGPVVLVLWTRTVLSAILWPQKYFNSILLMVRLMVTVIFTSGFFGDNGGYFLLGCFLLLPSIIKADVSFFIDALSRKSLPYFN